MLTPAEGPRLKLTPAVMHVLAEAFGFTPRQMAVTRWLDYRRHWFGRAAVWLRPETTAIVWGRLVLFHPDRLAELPPNEVFELIAHEQTHRAQQTDGRVWFYVLYVWRHIRYGYDGNPYELEAYRNGMSQGARAELLWNETLPDGRTVGQFLTETPD